MNSYKSSGDVNINNCLLVLLMENELQHDQLRIRRLAVDMAAENFRYLCHQNLFLNLNYNVLQDIICNTKLRISNKRMVNTALHRWLGAKCN